MIPKIIYNLWIGDGIPNNQYVDKWKSVCKNYEIKNITSNNIEIESDWFDKCVKERNFINACGFARFYYLYKYGGIYLDNDIEIIKNFDDLLDKDKLIIGSEDDIRVNDAVLITPPKNPVILECMNRIKQLPTDTRPDLVGPQTLTDVMKDLGWSKDEVFENKDVISLPHDYFYPFHYTQKFNNECLTKNTHCIHYWAGSWK